MTIAGSKAEEYVQKINRLYDIHLERELRHVEDERRFYLKTFRTEFKLVIEKRQKIRNKAKEYRRLRVLKNQEISAPEGFREGNEEIFITEVGTNSPEVKNCYLFIQELKLVGFCMICGKEQSLETFNVRVI